MPFIIHAAWLNDEPVANQNASTAFASQDIFFQARQNAPEIEQSQHTNESPLPGGRLFVWAEDLNIIAETAKAPSVVNGVANGVTTSVANSGAKSPSRSRTTSHGVITEKTPSHPFQATVAQLRSWLGSESSVITTSEITPANVTVLLPSQEGMPTVRRSSSSGSSSRRERAKENVEPSAVLSAWQVTGLAIPPFAALQLLSQIGAIPLDTSVRNGGWHRVQYGKDLQFWSHAAKLTLEILVGQQYVPALRPDSEGNIGAIWQPVLLNHQLHDRFDQLVTAMPPVCRAYNLRHVFDAPSPRHLLEHAMANLVDAALQQVTRQVLVSSDVAAPSVHIDGTVVNEWLRALRNRDRRLRIPPQLLFRFYEQWQSWLEQLQSTADALFRACFVLVSPDPYFAADPHAGWSLQYELQACDTLSLRIPSKEIWGSSSASLRVGSRRLDRPQDRLLAGLGAASRLFAPIAESLRSTKPERAELTTAEAYQFLREIGPLLETIGFGVIYPDWWHSNKRGQLGLRLRMSAPLYTKPEWQQPRLPAPTEPGDLQGSPNGNGSNGGISTTKVNYSWELTLGEKPLSQNDFERIAGLHTPLLWLDERWVELDPSQINAARRFIGERPPTGQMSFLESLRLLQGVQRDDDSRLSITDTRPPSPGFGGQRQSFYLPSDAPTILPLQAVDVDGWLLDLLHQLRNRQPPQPINEPPGFIGELRPYQRRGVGWLDFMTDLGLGVCLADDMGLGKTIQAIALLLNERENYLKSNGNAENGEAAALHTPTLIICPTSVLANWRHEITRFAPTLRVMIHHGNNRLGTVGFAQAVREHDVIITSFGTARRDIEMLQRWTWSHLILDEAQNIKNPGAKQSQAVRAIDARRRIALTGTPVENRLSELWSILDFLNPGYLEGFERFRQRYVMPIERYNDEESAAELRRLVQPFFLRRVKSDPTIISDLPEKQEMVVYCSLTEEQAALYEKTVRETLEQIDSSTGIQRRGQVLALLTKLKQIANHPAHYLKQAGPLPHRSGKLERLTEMLEEAVEVGDHALVFTQFVEMGTLLQRHLSETLGVDVLFLHGGTPANQRDRMVQAFQADDGPPIFVLRLRAGGSGLNLTRANHVFHFDRWWNPAVENQATDRAFRIGQKRNVLVHKFVAAGTLEDRIQAILESKQALADAIVGSGEDWLTELSTDDLRDMLMLRHEMVEDL